MATPSSSRQARNRDPKEPRKLTEEQVSRLLLIQDAYFATGGFEDGTYLRRHSRETEGEYNSRKDLRHYQNFIAPVFDASYSPVFGQDAVRAGGAPLYPELQLNADAAGTALQDFTKATTRSGGLYGYCIVGMDSFSNLAPDLATTLEKRLFPYLFTVEPAQVETYLLDRRGRLVYFTYFEEFDIHGGTEVHRAHLRSRDGVGGLTRTQKPDGAPLTEWVEIPVFPYLFELGARPNRQTLPVSSWATLADTARIHFNLNSLISTQEFQNTFNILTIQGAKQEISLGEGSVLWYPKDHNKPEFISPGSDTIEVLMKHLEDLKVYIYQVSYQGLAVASSTASGESKKWTDRFRQESLATLARKVEDLELWVANAFSIWTTGRPVEVEIRYPKDFADLSITEDLGDALKILDLGVSVENANRVRADILLRRFSDATPADKKLIEAAELSRTDYTPPDEPADQTVQDDQGAGV